MTAASMGDANWYRDRAVESRGPVLELGVGTGRTAIPIARAGVSVTGIEADAGMIEACRERLGTEATEVQDAFRLLSGDMRDFDLSERFAQIQIPFRAFLHNRTREDQLCCLRCCAAHLAEGGALRFNVFHPSLEYMSNSAGAHAGTMRMESVVDRGADGFVLYFESTAYDTPTQTLRSVHRFEWYGADGVMQRTTAQVLDLAYLYPGDLRDLLRCAGFRDIQIDGGFDGSALDGDGQELVVTARL